MNGRPVGGARRTRHGGLRRSSRRSQAERRTMMSAPLTATPQVSSDHSTGGSAAGSTGLPPYSHELDWPEGMAPFKVVDDGTQGDPYRHYQWMRDNAPV